MARVVHFEIHASNPEETLEFYKELFGWEVSQWPGMDDYWLLKTGPADTDGIDGGMLVRRGDSPEDGQAVNAYVCTLGVENLDDILQRLEPAGGKLAVEKMPIPGVGWLAYAKDPAGNIFGILQPDMNSGTQG